MKDLTLVLGDQLFAPDHFSQMPSQHIFMAEDWGLCTRFRYHKLKIVLFLSAMRHFRDEMERGYSVHYHSLSSKKSESYVKRLKRFLKSNKIKRVHHFEIADEFFREELSSTFEGAGVEAVVYKSPMFLTSKQDFAAYLKKVKKPQMKTFYEGQRKQLKILLMRNGRPEGGRWSFDEDNRNPYKKGMEVPQLPKSKHSKLTTEVMDLVESSFGDHPGSAADFFFPVTRREARKWLKNFLDERLAEFGPYEDAITNKSPILFHSLLTPLLNTGLLTPKEVIDAVIERYEAGESSIASTEGFVRQVMGWREFMKGIYDNYSSQMNSKNFFKHKRKLADSWYTGETGIPPLDDAIKKAHKHAYCHHIERLMILSNMMLISQIDPKNAFEWFMEMFVDSADWVMEGNVYGMGQFSEGGIFATKPYICGSNYWIKMGDYKKGEWADAVDGLYWGFIKKHRKFFEANHRLSMMPRMLDKMKEERKKTIFKAANTFLEEHTC